MSMLSKALDSLPGKLRKYAAPTATVTLYSRTSEGQYEHDGVPWLHYVLAHKTDDVVMTQAQVGQTWRKFQLWKETQDVLPQMLDRIDDGNKWQIKVVEPKGQGTIFNCHCLKEL
jgi:hypothetical protein